MTEQMRGYIMFNYDVNACFYSHDIYREFLGIGWSNSQISSTLNNLKRQGMLISEPRDYGLDYFDPATGRRCYKKWRRLR